MNPAHPLRTCLRLTLFSLALVLCAPGWAARLALVIGNDAYQKVDALKNARNDARLMASILRKAGFEVTQAVDLGRDSLWNTIDTFRGRINKGDEVVFYFSGHGVQIGANQLLLPIDIEARNDAQVQRDGVPLVDVQDVLKDARVAVLLLDACRDNPFPKTGTRSIGSTRGLTPPEASTGQIIMMSAGRNQKALDYVPNSAQANGLFAWELSQVLRTPGLEIRNALEQVKERVDDQARQAGHEQRPSLVNDLRGSFYLTAGSRTQVASVRTEPVNITQPPGSTGAMNLEDLEKEETARKKWAQWQMQMKADFDRTLAFNGSADLQAKAWDRFVSAWSQDNPLSRDDEDMRVKAQAQREQARQQSAASQVPVPTRSEPVRMPAVASTETIDGRYQILAGGEEVRDLKTGLIWKRCSVGQTWSGMTCTGQAGVFDFNNAQKLSGNGWEVPSKDQLLSLVDKTAGRPTINQKAFPATPPTKFWTSSPDGATYARNVDFDEGREWRLDVRRGEYPVRGVRISQ